MVIWLTGLSGAGKSTLAQGLSCRFHEEGTKALLIDGDVLREELCRDLGFSTQDRSENIRRAGAVALIAARSGIMSICSLISPLQSERDAVRELCKKQGVLFFEVYVSTTLETCEKRDPKGLYKKARCGMIPQFTGIDSPYEKPRCPDFTISTEEFSVEDSIALLMNAVKSCKNSIA